MTGILIDPKKEEFDIKRIIWVVGHHKARQQAPYYLDWEKNRRLAMISMPSRYIVMRKNLG